MPSAALSNTSSDTDAHQAAGQRGPRPSPDNSTLSVSFGALAKRLLSRDSTDQNRLIAGARCSAGGSRLPLRCGLPRLMTEGHLMADAVPFRTAPARVRVSKVHETNP